MYFVFVFCMQEFFARYPTLFPFLLGELASLLGHEVITNAQGIPLRVQVVSDIEEKKSADSVSAEHPSLFPLLLLLAKMRSELVSRGSTKDGEEDGEEEEEHCEDSGIRQNKALNLSLFVPLVQLCCQMRRYQVKCYTDRDYYLSSYLIISFVYFMSIIPTTYSSCFILN